MDLFTGFFLPSFVNNLERPSTEKLKFKHLNGVFGMVWDVLIFWDSKSTWFCVCENKSFIVAKIMTKHVKPILLNLIQFVLKVHSCKLYNKKYMGAST